MAKGTTGGEAKVELIEAILRRAGLRASTSAEQHLLTYLNELLRWNKKINLCGIRSFEELVDTLLYESLYLCKVEEFLAAEDILDIGSGGGFPALPLAVVFDKKSFTLLEPREKRYAFLCHIKRLCGLENVDIKMMRLEEFIDQQQGISCFKCITMRAVGDMENIIQQAQSLLAPGGSIITYYNCDKRLPLSTKNILEIHGSKVCLAIYSP